MKIAVLTPTRNRLYTLLLLHNYIERQTRKPDLWIVATDGQQPDFPHGSVKTIVSTADYAGTPIKSFTSNLLRGVSIAQNNEVDAVLIMEDDDWYGASYVETMERLLKDGDFAGISHFQELRFVSGQHRAGIGGGVVLCQMGFTKKIIPIFESSVKEAHEKSSFEVDRIFSRNIKHHGVRLSLTEESGLAYGLKGIYYAQSGETAGLTTAHRIYRRTIRGYAMRALHSLPFYKSKLRHQTFAALSNVIGEDSKAYHRIIWGAIPTEGGEF